MIWAILINCLHRTTVQILEGFRQKNKSNQRYCQHRTTVQILEGFRQIKEIQQRHKAIEPLSRY